MNEYNIIETERLRLTSWQNTEEDAQGLFLWASRPNVGPNAGWKPHASLEESRKILREMFIPGGDGYAIRLKDTDEIIGNISVYEDTAREGVKSMELGYALSDIYWGKGYMTEAAKRLVRYAFDELNLDVLMIRTSDTNMRSQRVIDKCGFRYEGTLRRAYKTYDNNLREVRCYSMLKEEYENLYLE